MNKKIRNPEITQKHNTVAWLLLGGLLFLRIPFMGVLGCFSKSA